MSRFATNGDQMAAEADALGLPRTSIWKAQEGLAKAKKTNADVSLARLMLRFGRLTPEARNYVAKEYPQCVS